MTALLSLLTVFTLCDCGRWRTMSLSLQMVFYWLMVALIGATWPCPAHKGLLFLHKSQGVTPQKDKEPHFVIDFWAQISQTKKRGVKRWVKWIISFFWEGREEKCWKVLPIDLEVKGATNTTSSLSNLKYCRNKSCSCFCKRNERQEPRIFFLSLQYLSIASLLWPNNYHMLTQNPTGCFQ